MADSSDRLDEIITALGVEFEDFAAARLDKGSQEYGSTAFLKNDMLRYIAEELADLANYAQFMYIKLRMLEEEARARGIDLANLSFGAVREEDKVPSGPTSFIPFEDIFQFLPRTPQGG